MKKLGEVINNVINYTSPTLARANKEVKNTNDFFTEYFKSKTDDDYNSKHIRVGAITAKGWNDKYILADEVTNKEIIAYLFDHFRSKSNEHLKEPNSDLKKFIPVTSLDFSGVPLELEDIKFLTDCLRDTTTIKILRLEDCDIDDRGIRYLADTLMSNKEIMGVSLLKNEKITKMGIKNLLNLIANNNTLKELYISLYTSQTDNEIYFIEGEINICDKNLINKNLDGLYKSNIEIEIVNKNLKSLQGYTALVKNTYAQANKLLNLITKSHNEIFGKNILDQVLIMLGMRDSGMTVLGYQLSESQLPNKFTVTESNTLKFVLDKENKNIRHTQGPENNPDHPYKLVNNFLYDTKTINIMECAGISSTGISSIEVDPIQKILDGYTCWQILRLAKEIKFGLIIRDNIRRDTLVSTITQFTNFFKNQNNLLTPENKQQLQDALFCIVTFATECGKTSEEIAKKIKAVQVSLNNISQDPDHQFITSQLIKFIHLFRKAILGEPFSETLSIEDLIGNNNVPNNNGLNNKNVNNLEPNYVGINQNVELVQNLDPSTRVSISDKQFDILIDNNLILQEQRHPPQDTPNDNALVNNNANNNEPVNSLVVNDNVNNNAQNNNALLQEQGHPPQDAPNDNALVNNNANNNINNRKWSTLKDIYIQPFACERDEIILPRILTVLVNENISVVGKIIMKFFQINENFINDPFFSFYKLDLQEELISEIFSTHYNLLECYLPNLILSEAITKVQKVDKTFFPTLKEIAELRNAYSKNENESFKMVCEFLEIIRKFYSYCIDIESKIDFQYILGNYIYLLKQHWEALLFCKKIFPQYENLNPLKEVVDTAKNTLITNDLLNKTIIHIRLKPCEKVNNIEASRQKIDYYKQALEWLNGFNAEKFSDFEKPDANFTVNEMKATAHYYLGILYENNSQFDNNGTKLYCLLSIREYIEALKIELKEYFNSDENEKNYSFFYGNHNTTFTSVCEKIANLLLKLGKSYERENQNDTAIKLIKEAMQYFKISVNTAYVAECEDILTGIFRKEPQQNIKDKLQKELCSSLGEFLLKLGFSDKAFYEFDKARSLAEFGEKESLLLRAISAKETDTTTNSAFHKAMYKKGKIEDLSIFKDKPVGKILLEFTKKIVLEVINLVKESPDYVDPYELPQPPVVPQSQNAAIQAQAQELQNQSIPTEAQQNQKQSKLKIVPNLQLSNLQDSFLNMGDGENVVLSPSDEEAQLLGK